MKKSASIKVKAGVVGAGIGQAHIRGYQAAEGAEVVALCDINRARAQQVAKEYGIPQVYTDYGDMLKKADINAVSVATPNNLHMPMAIAALKAGMHVLCEKPLAMNAKEGERIAAQVTRSRRVFMVGYTLRYLTEGAALKKLVETGSLGEIYYAKATYLRRRGIPGMGGWFTTKAVAGGGPLIDVGVHVLDLAVWLMGKPRPVSVYGSVYAKFGPYGKGRGGYGEPQKRGTFDVEDLACGMVKFDNGATVSLEVSWASHIKTDVSGCQLFGTKGGATTRPLEIFTETSGMPVDIVPTPEPMGGHIAEVAHFVECIRDGKPCEAPVEDGVAIMKMLDALYRSAETGRQVLIT